MKSTQKTMDRRTFMKISALTGGGVILGFNLFQSCKPKSAPSTNEADLNYHEFNAFIKIAPNGKVTIFSPNPEIGQGVKTSMPMLIAEELDVAWEDVKVVQGGLDTKNYTRQIAGGSNSIKTAWLPLRQTGATTKQMLINAAAKKWGVAPNECTTNKGIITHKNGKTLTYGEVVLEASALEIPKEVPLKHPKDFTIIGQGKQNVDLEKIISGKPLFGIDYKEEGMLYASVIHPPALGQKLLNFDKSKAVTVSGVVDVISFDHKIAILAMNTWASFAAQQKVTAQWSSNINFEGTPEIEAQLNKGLEATSKKVKIRREDGDVAAAFKNADTIVEHVYEAPFLPHNCMEPMNFFAHVTDTKIDLIGPIQTPANAAKSVAKLLNRNIDEVSLKMTRMGGGFGRRLKHDFVVEAAQISNLVKKPIKLNYKREDDMAAGFYRPTVKYKIKAALKKGKITAYHVREAAYKNMINGKRANYFPASSIENYKVDTIKIKGLVTTGAWRAPICNFLAFAEQSFLDELAIQIKKDPIQLRLDLLEEAKKNKNDRMEYAPERMEQVIRTVAEKSNWGKTPQGTFLGFSAYFSHSTHVAEVAEVVLEEDSPVLKKVHCVIDCGIVVNPLGAKNQAEGGVIDGIGHAMYGELLLEKGVPQSTNFGSYRLIRMNETPEVIVHFIESNEAPTGLGEPTLPPAGAAIANAIFAATGNRIRKQPLSKYGNV